MTTAIDLVYKAFGKIEKNGKLMLRDSFIRETSGVKALAKRMKKRLEEDHFKKSSLRCLLIYAFHLIC